MTEIVNLRSARKAKMRAEKDKQAKANRVLYGTPKKLRKLAEARTEQAARNLENSRLDDNIKDK